VREKVSLLYEHLHRNGGEGECHEVPPLVVIATGVSILSTVIGLAFVGKIVLVSTVFDAQHTYWDVAADDRG